MFDQVLKDAQLISPSPPPKIQNLHLFHFVLLQKIKKESCGSLSSLLRCSDVNSKSVGQWMLQLMFRAFCLVSLWFTNCLVVLHLDHSCSNLRCLPQVLRILSLTSYIYIHFHSAKLPSLSIQSFCSYVSQQFLTSCLDGSLHLLTIACITFE